MYILKDRQPLLSFLLPNFGFISNDCFDFLLIGTSGGPFRTTLNTIEQMSKEQEMILDTEADTWWLWGKGLLKM